MVIVINGLKMKVFDSKSFMYTDSCYEWSEVFNESFTFTDNQSLSLPHSFPYHSSECSK